MRLAGAGFDCGIMHCASLNFGDARWNTDHHARLWHDRETFVHLPDEVVQHQLGDIEIADDTVFEWPNRDDIRRRSANHAFGIRAYGQRSFCLGVDRDHRGLVDNNALTANQHERVRGPEIDADVTGKHTHDTVEWITQSHFLRSRWRVPYT